MNTYRIPLLSLLCLLLLAPAALTAQDPPAGKKPDEKTAPAAEKPDEKKAPTAANTEVTFTQKEIDKLAKALNEVEKWEAKQRFDKQATAWKKFEKLLEAIRKSKREPLAAVSSWSKVFASDKYQRFSGRSGRQRNKKLQFTAMGRTLDAVWHADVPGVYRAKTPIGLVLGLSPTKGKFRGEEFLRQLWAEKELQTVIVAAPDFPTKQTRSKKRGRDKEDDEAKPISWSDRSALWASMGVLGQLTRDYNIAYDRLFLDGYGDGATEVWKMASCFADTYAGCIVRGALPPEGTRLEDFRNTAFLLIGIPGAEMTPAKADALGAQMVELGIDATVANLSEAPKKRKEKDAFESATAATSAFLKKQRPRYPEQLDWSVKMGHTRRHFYVRSVREIEDEAIADAKEREIRPNFQVKIDRKNNKLVITCHRIIGLKILLNDAILNLDQDVTIDVNGKTLFNGRPKRSLKGLYDGFLKSGDWTRIFTWDVGVEIPQPEKPEEEDDKAEGEDEGGKKKDDEGEG